MKPSTITNSLGAFALLFSSIGFAANVTVVPSNATPIIGSTFYVDLFGNGFPDVVGATLQLTFNSYRVSIVSPAVTAGFSTAGGQFTGGVAIPPTCTPVYVSGASCNFSILGPLVGTLPTGNFGGVQAVRISFIALASGFANIQVIDDGADFSFTDATTFGAVPTTYTQANVFVGCPADLGPCPPTPIPATAWLLATGLAGLVGRRLRRSAA